MNQKGQRNGLLGIAIIVLIGAGLILGGFYLIGQMKKTDPLIEELNENPCFEQIKIFDKEYHQETKSHPIFLDRTNFYIVTFTDEWTVIVNSNDCRIVEEKDVALLRYQIWDYDNILKNIDVNLYESTQDCFQVSVAEGGSTACDIVKPINQAINSPITSIIAKIPTEMSQSLVKALIKEGWKETAGNITGKVVTLTKTVKGSGTILAILEIVEMTGCPLKKVPEKAIFEFAWEGNQILGRAKSHQYEASSISQIDAINAYIIALESIEIEQTQEMLGLDLEEMLGDALIGAARIIGNFDQSCSKDNQIAKFRGFQEKIEGNEERGIQMFNQFEDKLKKLKSEANQYMDAEKTAKEVYFPKGMQFFISKAIAYNLEPSESQALYDQQLYISAKEAAEEKIEVYKHYWDETNTTDWFVSIFIWAIFIVPLGLFVFRVISYFIDKN